MESVQIAGMAWFAEDDYEAFRSVLPDRAWHATYHDWLAAAEANKKRIEEQGIRVVKAYVRADSFRQWCRDSGRHVDTQALTQFANEVAIREHAKMQPH